jgi:hypothetical protein
VAAALLLQAQADDDGGAGEVRAAVGIYLHDRRRRLRAGAGNVNFWTSRQVQANSGPAFVAGLVSCSIARGGVSFWDDGQLQNRLYSGSGIRLIISSKLPGLLLNPTKLRRAT